MERSNESINNGDPWQNIDREARRVNRPAMSPDEGIGAFVLLAAKTMLTLFCLIFLLATIGNMNNDIFPNQAGWHDIATMEFIFYGFWLYLTYRYASKTLLHFAPISVAIYRYLLAFGIHGMLFVSTPHIAQLVSPEVYAWTAAREDILEVTKDMSWLLLLFSIVPKGRIHEDIKSQ